jgi:hypothetical protein
LQSSFFLGVVFEIIALRPTSVLEPATGGWEDMRTADREGEGNQSPFSPKKIGSSHWKMMRHETAFRPLVTFD